MSHINMTMSMQSNLGQNVVVSIITAGRRESCFVDKSCCTNICVHALVDGSVRVCVLVRGYVRGYVHHSLIEKAANH